MEDDAYEKLESISSSISMGLFKAERAERARALEELERVGEGTRFGDA